MALASDNGTVFAVAERQSYIGRIRDLCKQCAEAWVKLEEASA